MKKKFKQLATWLALMVSTTVFSQVGIKTTTPHSSADLELGSTNKTLYLNRVANPATDIADPQPGMMLYDTTEHCVKAYGGDPAKWSNCLGKKSGTPKALPPVNTVFNQLQQPNRTQPVRE